MEVLDQVKDRVEKLVDEVKTNTNEVQGKAQERMEKVRENYKTAVEALKGEIEQSSKTFKGYQERISTKMKKHFNGKELVADIREEVDLFSRELKDSVGRIKAAFQKQG